MSSSTNPFSPAATAGPAPPRRVPPPEEREITEAVDLCMPDGKHLNPAAKGWSRRPLHTANLRGGWGRTKRWDYWAVLAGDLVVSVTYADVDYLGLADLWWVDLATGETGGRPAPLPLGRGVFLPEPARHLAPAPPHGRATGSTSSTSPPPTAGPPPP
jgi:hypothetical protein